MQENRPTVAFDRFNPQEHPYEALLFRVWSKGDIVPTRAVLRSTGEKVSAISLLGEQIRFSLRDRCWPLITTKDVAWKSVVQELYWFLRGETNVRPLQEARCTIWDEWADGAGDLGPVYGRGWRSYPGVRLGPEGRIKAGSAAVDGSIVEVDQLAAAIESIRTVIREPDAGVGRRIILNAWNPPQIDQMALPPCHLLVQFFVRNGGLTLVMYQRSADLFLGVPFNIASYALLAHMVAAHVGIEAHCLVMDFGDAHIYTNHLDAVSEQLMRTPRPYPRVEFAVADPLSDLGNPGAVAPVDYDPHPKIKAEVAV